MMHNCTVETGFDVLGIAESSARHIGVTIASKRTGATYEFKVEVDERGRIARIGRSPAPPPEAIAAVAAR